MQQIWGPKRYAECFRWLFKTFLSIQNPNLTTLQSRAKLKFSTENENWRKSGENKCLAQSFSLKLLEHRHCFVHACKCKSITFYSCTVRVVWSSFTGGKKIYATFSFPFIHISACVSVSFDVFLCVDVALLIVFITSNTHCNFSSFFCFVYFPLWVGATVFLLHSMQDPCVTWLILVLPLLHPLPRYFRGF